MINSNLRDTKDITKTPKEIFLVEDNPGDVYLVRSSLANSNIDHNFYHVRDGEEIMACLHQKQGYQDLPWPDLILLDLNLPGKTGFEVLTEIKSDPKFRVIPVIILTSSNSQQDIIHCYQKYANSYIIKPSGYLAFFEAIRQLELFWFNLVQLPAHSS